MSPDERALLLALAQWAVGRNPHQPNPAAQEVYDLSAKVRAAQQQPPATPEKAAEPKCETCAHLGDKCPLCDEMDLWQPRDGTGRQPSEAKAMSDRFTKVATEMVNAGFYGWSDGRDRIADALRKVAEETRERCTEVARAHFDPTWTGLQAISEDHVRAIRPGECGAQIADAIRALDLSEASHG